jgi:hypothetical protein
MGFTGRGKCPGPWRRACLGDGLRDVPSGDRSVSSVVHTATNPELTSGREDPDGLSAIWE